MLNDRSTWLKVDFHIVQYNLNRAGHFLSESGPVVLYFSSATKLKKTCHKYSCFRYLKWYPLPTKWLRRQVFSWRMFYMKHIIAHSKMLGVKNWYFFFASGITCFFLNVETSGFIDDNNKTRQNVLHEKTNAGYSVTGMDWKGNKENYLKTSRENVLVEKKWRFSHPLKPKKSVLALEQWVKD